MDLVLWRHADAEDGIPDEARRLTAKGRKQAKKMAAWLAVHLPAGYRVLVSPATRTQETAGALTEHAVIEKAVSTAATPQGVLKAAGWPEGTGTVVVVGHQPTLGAVAALALTGEAQAWSVKKGAIWWIARDDDGDVQVRAVLTPAIL
ncbi:MAG: putative phosphohistidine phosphatase [Proteobacteria bacterium]|nr:putative phosphohistidine phosphatase [Pseudomonadota bacterium]RPJ45905.1 MAG: histidine phosphatase family protein [Betaproteobacteria bacterium]